MPEQSTVENVTSDGSVLVMDDGSVYSTSEDASSWESEHVHVSEDESKLTKADNGEQLEVGQVGNASDQNPYPDTGEHTQETNSSDGAIVVLDDGSVWSVEAGDQATASVWTDSTSITVGEGSGNDYTLIDTEDHEAVTAHYIGSK